MDIPVTSDALDVAFHPSSSSNLLATGLISGKVQLIDFGAGASASASASKSASKSASAGAVGNDEAENEKPYAKKWSVRPSHKSCRGVAFTQNGDGLMTLSKEGAIHRLDTESGGIVSTWSKAHQAAPSRVLTIDQNVFATGDDDGVVSLWDARLPAKESSFSAIRSHTHHFDWITSMLWCKHLAPPRKKKLTREEEEEKRVREEKKRKRKERKGKKRAGAAGMQDDDLDADVEDDSGASSRERLVVTSGDGTLSVIDIRAGSKGVEVSEDQEDELLSIAPVKRDSKLVVGSQLGALLLWAPTKGLLDHVDRIPGHPMSVDAICKLDEDTILTGSSDGLVRVVQIMPHKFLGLVADHGGMPVERLARRDNWLASIGHGSEIKLTDLRPLLEGDSDDEDEDVEEEDNEEQDDNGELTAQSRQEDDDSHQGDALPARSIKRQKASSIVTQQSREEQSTADFFADL